MLYITLLPQILAANSTEVTARPWVSEAGVDEYTAFLSQLRDLLLGARSVI